MVLMVTTCQTLQQAISSLRLVSLYHGSTLGAAAATIHGIKDA